MGLLSYAQVQIAPRLSISPQPDYTAVPEILLKLPGIDEDVVDNDGWTPLHAAAHWIQERPLRLLAVAGASFDRITLTVRDPHRVMPALILIRVRIQDLYTLRNAIYKSLSVLEKGYSGTYVGISNDAERVPPCESQPLLNFGMGLFYFTNEADARRFIYSDQGFLESDFLECSDMMIIPMAKPMHLNSILIAGPDIVTLNHQAVSIYEPSIPPSVSHCSVILAS
ncbi:unnamed protein product [Schistocephalus solidus]|uniref:ANK_REP_REGION domain-containing protein n=1 Tax=Schistocephalus solidus TaxID=70667 RepID=A0A183TK81_SCHSO|nr:unnamed protein product [Schistocephalus solidus]